MALTPRASGVSTPTAGSANCVITKPSGLTVGDLMIAHVHFRNGNSLSPPDGTWTSINTIVRTTTNSMACWWKIATSGDVAASTFTFTGTSGANCGKIYAFSAGYASSSPIDTTGNQSYAGGAAGCGFLSGTLVANTVLMQCYGAQNDDASPLSAVAIVTSDPGGWTTLTALGNATSGNSIEAFYSNVRSQTTGTTGSSATQNVSRNGVGIIFNIKPATGSNQAIAGGSFAATSTFSGSVRATKLVKAGSFAATSAFSGAVTKPKPIVPGNINSTTTLSATIKKSTVTAFGGETVLDSGVGSNADPATGWGSALTSFDIQGWGVNGDIKRISNKLAGHGGSQTNAAAWAGWHSTNGVIRVWTTLDFTGGVSVEGVCIAVVASGAGNGYVCSTQNLNSKIVVQTQAGAVQVSLVSQAVSSGDGIGLERASNGDLKIYYRSGTGGSWTLLNTTNDSNVTGSSWWAGLYTGDGNTRFVNFAAGDGSGTSSGLTGINPNAMSATSTFGGTLTKTAVKPLTAATMSATSTLSGSVAKLKSITGGSFSALSTFRGVLVPQFPKITTLLDAFTDASQPRDLTTYAPGVWGAWDNVDATVSHTFTGGVVEGIQDTIHGSATIYLPNPNPDAEFYMTITALNGQGVVAVHTRAINSSGNNYLGYRFSVNHNGSWQLSTDTGFEFASGNLAGGAPAAGDQFGIRSQGTITSAWYKRAAAGIFSLIAVADDPTITGTGYIGFEQTPVGGTQGFLLDDAKGGPILSARSITGGNFDATSLFSGSVRRRRPIVPASIAATSTFGGSVTKLAQIKTGSFAATSTFSGSVRKLALVKGGTFTATSTFSGSIARARPISGGSFAATSAFSGTVKKLAAIRTGNFTATSTFSGVLRSSNPPIIDFNSEANFTSNLGLSGDVAFNQALGNIIVGDGETIGSAKFYLDKVGTPTGNAVAKVYAISSGVPSGAALATSGNVNVAALSTSLALITFTFSGASNVALTSGTLYALVIEYSGGDGSNFVNVGASFPSGRPSGLRLINYNGTWHIAGADAALIFYLYGFQASTIAGTFNATSTFSGTVTKAAKLIAGGSFAATSTFSGSVRRLRPIVPTTMSATSTFSGAVVRGRSISGGSFAATSTFSGTVGKPKSITGTFAATSTFSGNIATLKHITAGSFAATSTFSGSVGRARPITGGTFNATSTFSGTVGKPKSITGTFNATSTFSGAVRAFKLIRGGTFNATSTFSGAVVRLRPITGGSFAATSTFSGMVAKQVKIVGGNFAAASTFSGALRVLRAIQSGTFNATSTFSGRINKLAKITGNFAATSAFNGNVSKSGTAQITAGNFAATSTFSGNVVALKHITGGSFNATSTFSDNIFRLRPITGGTFNATSTFSGSVTGLKHVTGGTFTATSTFSGAVGRARPITGATFNATSMFSGSIHMVRGITAGNFAATSTFSGAITAQQTIKSITPTSNIFATSTFSGSVAKQVRLVTATFNATSTFSGSIRRLRPITGGSFAATSTFSGVLIKSGTFIGTFNATSTFSGSVRTLHKITGTFNATSTFSGTVAALKHITSGSFAAISTFSGNVVRSVRIIPATINATSTFSGNVFKSGTLLGNFAAISSFSGRVTALRTITAGSFNSITTFSGSVITIRPISGANFSATSVLTGLVIALRAIRPANIISTTNFSGSVFRQFAANGQFNAISVFSGNVSGSKRITSGNFMAISVFHGDIMGHATIRGANISAISTFFFSGQSLVTQRTLFFVTLGKRTWWATLDGRAWTAEMPRDNNRPWRASLERERSRSA